MANGVNRRFVEMPNGKEEVDLSEFAERVVKSLGKADIRDVAKDLPWGYDAVYGYLTAKNKAIPHEFLVVIARLTNRSLLWLLTGEGPEFNESFLLPATTEDTIHKETDSSVKADDELVRSLRRLIREEIDVAEGLQVIKQPAIVREADKKKSA